MVSVVAAIVACAMLVQAIPFANVASGVSSQIDEPREVIIRTQADWQAFWKTHSTQPAPVVDFSRSIVAGVFLGMRPTGGYAVTIKTVRRTPTGAVIEYLSSTPDKNQAVIQMLTSPFHLIAIPIDIGRVEFKQVTGAGLEVKRQKSEVAGQFLTHYRLLPSDF
jgi:PrcB C-terminal